MAHLEVGNSELARQELGVLIDFRQSASKGPDLLAMLITNTATQIVIESTKSILHHRNWAPEDLLFLRHQLMAIDLLEDYATSLRFAMASAVDGLTKVLGTEIPLLGKIPFDVRLREGGDSGEPLVLAFPDSPAGEAIYSVSAALSSQPRGLAGMSLNISPAGR